MDNLYRNTAAQPCDECTSPSLGELLTAYVVELLEDSAAAEVEDHLLDCLHCRDKYLKMLTLSSAERETTNARGDDEEEPVSSGAKVLRISDFKKRRS